MFGPRNTQERRYGQREGFGAGLTGGIIAVVLISSNAAGASSLDNEIARLEAEIVAHADEVFQLEQKLPHSVDTRLAVFLTLASRDGFGLDSVEMFVNGEPVASHLYSTRESDALQQGGVQELFTGNLANGQHQLRAVVTARAPNDHFVRRETTHRFQKRPGKLRLKMVLEATAPDYEPRVSMAEWK
ncbi:MAG: hypothetical protein ACI92N_001933 [Pseudomonadales bacterium]|jgi:hypothetical protein|uniref:AraC family transcriptional regulator n=1 Tax=Marinobacter maritimus TaxID=277961 RepID=UPI001FE88BAE|nr:AraC family transcriptional regulator [Marinobacter maritimus]